MKRLVTLVLLSFVLSLAFSNDDILKSKRGTPILPVQGDFGLMFDANPFLVYAGTTFNNTSGSPGILASPPAFANQGIFFKYYLQDDLAVRAGVRFAFEGITDRRFVTDDLDTVSSDSKVKDIMLVNSSIINLGGDIIKYQGYGRLQGFFGAGLYFGYGNTRTEYEYGNSLNIDNPNPATHNFGNNLPNPLATDERVLEYTENLGFSLIIRTVVGVEFFFAPKMSIGGEFGFGFTYLNFDERNQEIERFDGMEYSIVEDKINPDKTIWNVDNMINGSVFLTFHF